MDGYSTACTGYLLGRKIAANDTVQLPEEKKLADLRRRYVTSGSAIDRAVVGLTEGGGARLFVKAPS